MPRRLGTRSGEKCLHAKGVSHPRQNLCAPRRLAASQASLSQARPGVGEEGARNALWRPVSGAGGSGTCFFPNPGPHVSALGSQIQDPGSGSRIGIRPALGASQKARGLHRRPLSFGASGQAGSGGFSSRWGGLQWQPLMLGTFQRKVLFDEYATCGLLLCLPSAGAARLAVSLSPRGLSPPRARASSRTRRPDEILAAHSGALCLVL